MNLIDKLSWSLRHCRKRFFESLLIVFAVGLGIAVIVAILSIVFNTQSQLADVMGRDEYFRTFRIYSAAHFSSFSSQEPILSVVKERPDTPLQISLAELDNLQNSLPEGMHVFVEQNFSYPSPLLPLSDEEDAQQFPQKGYVSLTSRRVDETVTVKNEESDVQGTSENETDIEEADTAHMSSGGSINLDTGESVSYTSYFPSIHEQYDTIFLTATTLPYFDFKQFEVALGNWFVAEDIEKGNQVIVLTDKLAKRLFPEEAPIGKQVLISQFGIDGDIQYEVIGVLAPLSEEQEQNVFFDERAKQAYIPVTAAPRYPEVAADGNRDIEFDSFIIGVDAEMDVAKSAEIIQAEMSQRYGELAVVQNYYLSSQSADDQVQSIYIIIGIFASLGLVIAVINILNLMLARVLRRTKSVGLSIALGAYKRSIFSQFFLEALLLGIIGAVLGILFSFGLLQIINNIAGMASGMKLVFGFKEILTGCGLGLLVSLLFGIYPAYQGAQINPVDALRTD